MMREWEKVRLKEIAEITGGGTPSKSNEDYWDGSIPWLTPTDVTTNNKNYLDETKKYITKLGLQKSSAKLIPEGNVLMTSRATIGKSIINKIPMTTNQGFANFICDKNRVSSTFLLYKLNSEAKKFEQLGSGSTFREISKGELKSFVIDLPPLDEQQKIAAILSSVDEAIEKTEEIIEQTNQVKKGLMQQLLTKGIGHTEFKQTPAGDIPLKWEYSLFSNLVDINPNYKLDKRENIEFVEMAAVQTDSPHVAYFTNKNATKSGGARFKNGDVLFARITPCTENGKTGLVSGLEATLGMGSTELFVFSPIYSNIDSTYLYYLAKSSRFRSKAISRMIGTTGRQRVPKEVFTEELFVPIPSLLEQKKIADTLYSFDERIAKEKEGLDRLNTLKRGLMQQLLTGTVRVPIDEDEVVET